jgi:thiamine kinase-like enzyme
MNKFLMESGWKSTLQQAKGKVKDNGLQRALAAYEKLPAEQFSERQTALQLISKLAGALNNPKGHLDVKAVADYLGNISAAVVKELQDLGKQQKSAAPDKASAPVASVKTSYGEFAYFSNDKANARVIETLRRGVEKLSDAQADFSQMKAALQEAEKIKKDIPPVRDIIESLKKADRVSADEGKQAKVAYLLFEEFQGKVVEVQEDAKNASLSAEAAVKELKASGLEEKAKELREEAEKARSAIEKIFTATTTALKLATAVASPDPISKLELASTAVETLESVYKLFGGSGTGLIEQAAENEKTAHELKLDAVADKMKQTKQHLEDLQKRQDAAIKLYGKAKALIAMTGKAPMKGFDKTTKGKFHFEILEAYADRLAEVCDLAKDAIDEAKLAYDISDVLRAQAAGGKWKLPEPEESKKILQQMKDEAIKVGKEAGVFFHAASPARIDAQKLYAQAQEALANSNS